MNNRLPRMTVVRWAAPLTTLFAAIIAAIVAAVIVSVIIVTTMA